jgi:hypothetical protein
MGEGAAVRIGCAAALVLVLGSMARARAAEPTNLRGAPSAADRQAYAQYQRQLQQLLAAERPNAATGLSTTSCKLFQAAPERVPAQECMTCHGMHTTHPVELDYEAARLTRPALRPGAEVIRRGVFLPDGKVQCVSCHDAASRWAYHLAIPPGAQVFTCEWGLTGTLMLALPERRFMVALDPTLFALQDPERYALWYRLPREAPPGLARTIREQFGARYAACWWEDRFRPFFDRIAFEPGVRPITVTGQWNVYELLDP